MGHDGPMRFGIDKITPASAYAKSLQGRKLAVLAHPASVNRELVHIGEVLDGVGLKPALFFGPEHGYGGEAQDMVGVGNAVDTRTGAPILSLYGDDPADLSPKAEHFSEIDALVIDLADVGSRY